MKKLKLALFAALTATAFSASATNFDLGTLTVPYINNAMVSGNISDTYTFDIGSQSPVASASSFVTLSSILGISGFSVTLFNSANTLLGSAAYDGIGQLCPEYRPAGGCQRLLISKSPGRRPGCMVATTPLPWRRCRNRQAMRCCLPDWASWGRWSGGDSRAAECAEK